MHSHTVGNISISSHNLRDNLPGKVCVSTLWRWARPLIVAVVVAVALFLEVSEHPVYALGPGQVCVFSAPSGAYGVGHVGWGFRQDQKNYWFYGATEGPSGGKGLVPVPPGGDNGAWIRTGNFNSMKSFFHNRKATPSKPYYTQYSCKNTGTSAVGAAISMANKIKGLGYNLVNNITCWDHTYDVLTAYDGNVLNGPDWAWVDPFTPNEWFNDLHLAGFSPVRNL